MAPRRIDGFFYGLFMDAGVLHQSGTEPSNMRRAHVTNFALRIGERATLVPSPGARTYGMLIALTHAEFDRLYGAPGLEAYRPEAVIAHTFDGEDEGEGEGDGGGDGEGDGGAVPALCYNLPEAPAPHERNPEYAMRLRRVLEELEFPDEYVRVVE